MATVTYKKKAIFFLYIYKYINFKMTDINKVLQNIDYIGLINLFERNDRLSNVFNEFFKYNISINNIDILRVNKHKLGGVFGCYDSHLKLYKKAIDSGANYALILEDDFVFIDNSEKEITKKLNKCINFIKKNQNNWDIIKITNDIFIYIIQKIDDCIYETKQASTQGYFINKHCMLKMLNDGVLVYKNSGGYHIDLAQNDIYKFKIYTIMPEIIKSHENSLINNNEMILPKILLDNYNYNAYENENFSYVFRYIKNMEPNHNLSILLADMNLHNMSDVYIYFNIFITLIISVCLYAYTHISKKKIPFLIYILISIIIIYLLIIIEQSLCHNVNNDWRNILSKYKLKKIYNNYLYDTTNNISELILK